MKKTVLTVTLIVLTIYGYTQTTLIKAGKMYNAESNRFEKNVDILITNGTIEKVAANITPPQNATIIDCPNCTVTPGLADVHTHLLYRESPNAKSVIEDAVNNTDADRSLRAVKFCKDYLQGGFTTIRDVGNSGMYLDVSLRNSINNGSVQGPSMYVSGPIISPYGGQTYNLPYQSQYLVDKEYRVIKDVEDAKLAVKEHIRMGVDYIKICADNTPGNLMLSMEEIKAITETAHFYGIKVTAHATFDQSVRAAVLGGVDGIEHGYDIADSTLDLMKKNNVYLVPTDLTYEGALKIFRLEHVDVDTGYVRNVINSFKTRLQRAYKKGVTIVLGRDFYFDISYPNAEASRDAMIAYYQAGLSAADVLKTATINAATILGRQYRYGSIKQGAVADIIIFNGDLESDFANTLSQIKTVLKNGQVVFTQQ